jgi:hypothetical protein
MYRQAKAGRWTRRIAVVGLLGAILATSAAPAFAFPYRNWARTDNNSAGVIFRPNGDYWEVYNNASGHTSVIYHYKGINDRFKSAAEVDPQGRTVVKHNVIEGRRIIFWVIGPDHRVSSKSEYRTSGG